MVNVDEAVIATLEKNGQKFEILVDCEQALKLRKGEEIDIRSVLAVMNVFKDARKGDVAPNLYETFETDSIEDIAREIINKGDINITADYKRKLSNEKKKQIISKISENAIDAKTKNPIPPKRIELAMEQINLNIHPFRSAEEQMKPIVESLRSIIPISFEERKFEVIIPAQYSAACYGILKKYGEIIKDEWLQSGALKATVKIPPRMVEGFIDELNKKTSGDVQIDEKGD